MFDARTWPASLVEFFYGDCAPFLDSEVPITCEEVFASLLVREELEYSLANDEVPYKASTQNRWSTPEIVALFADVRRRLATLAGARATFRRKGFTAQVNKVAEARAEHFIQAASLVGSTGGTREAMAHPDVHDNVKEALRVLTTTQVKVPGTEGHKTMLRHLGHAMNLIFGPATVFTTANYPDVRTAFVSLLDAGPAPPGGSPGVDLLRDDPAVPSVVELHRILARNPVAGARYFLLMQELSFRHGMGFDRLWFGRQNVAKHRVGDREDGYACSTQPCIGGPLKGGLAPNEAQGRGFAHSHGKGHGVANLSVERMRTLLAGSDEEVDAAVRAYQKGFLAEASTVQYDDALELGKQMEFRMEPPLPPVPFTQKQQMQSRMDGGKEEDGTSRDLVPLAPGDAVGHVAREGFLASAESRRPRSEYQIPLDGCPSSTMPTYRLLGAFGRCARLDACGRNPSPVPREVLMEAPPLQLGRRREVEAFLNPDGTRATLEQMIEESKTYGAALCHDARMLQVACHSHDCTFTCVKNQKTKDAPEESLKVHKTPLCRFHFFRTLRLAARPRGSDAPAEPELGKRLRKQLEEWLPGVGGKVGGKEWLRQAKDVEMTDEEFCIMALLACKPAKRASEELEDQRRGQIGVHLRRRTTEDQPALSV